MKIYSLDEIVRNAFAKSPFYRQLYQGVVDRERPIVLSQLPLVDQEKFWQANAVQGNALLTGKMKDGIVFKSGGTTGQPKFSVYTQEEWETFTQEFGRTFAGAGLAPADRVANLFYAGGLYASFIFIMKCLEQAEVPVLQFPISGHTQLEESLKILLEFDVNVLAGVPTTLISLLQLAVERKSKLSLRKIFFGGESLYPDQREWITTHFPGIFISSIGHASVDAGHLGFATVDCRYNEHWAFTGSSFMEIVDEETMEPITEMGVAGKLIYTNLTRLLMPIIRYPVGDRAVWVDASRSRYRIEGRSEEGARIGPVTLNRDDVTAILLGMDLPITILNMQLVLSHFDHKDQLLLKLAVGEEVRGLSVEGLRERIRSEIYDKRPQFLQEVRAGHIHPLQVELMNSDQLVKNQRTGKLKTIIDLR